MNLSLKSRDIAKTAVIAALYVALVWALTPISFGVIQVRVSNALIGIVPLVGMPGVLGITLGVLIGNIPSPLGPIDLLSAIPTFISLLLLMKLKDRSVLLGLFVYSVILSAWVGMLLSYTFGAPFLITFIYLLVGIGFATGILGYLVYRTLKSLVELK
ncbi:MAG: QueT transporter family protein [Candidatus Methanomethyliales bacterium]|nr:QueT transporter family protein [Candidatus Methanomethylicales archaeon]